jgi:hypothetical protein
MRLGRFLFGAVVLSLAASAVADVKHEGAWPSDEKKISIDADHKARNEVVQEVADKAGWSIIAQGIGNEPIDVHIKDQPASKILDRLLTDGSYVADRDDTMISISRADKTDAAAVAEPTASIIIAAPTPPPPAATVRGEDRKVTGGKLRIEKGETVHDVSVVGADCDVYGTVTGEISVMGGSVHLRDGSHVNGHVTAMGGSIDVDDGAVVDGDVGVMGGSLHRGPKSKIGGAIEIGEDEDHDGHRSFIQRVGDALTQSALLFVFGCVLLTLMGRRMEALQGEVAARPMRSFALGILGVLGFVATILALLITIIGIPVAIIVGIGAVLAMYGSICAVLATLGRALLKHKTDSPYVHLAVGCVIFLVVSHLPLVGGIVTLIVGLIGIGTLVATRIGGLWPGKNPNQGPYRTSPVV